MSTIASTQSPSTSPPGRSGAAQAFRLERVDLDLGGRAVLREVSLELAPGEAVALVGPSGAGKTTLLRVLGAAVAPDRGRVLHGQADPLAATNAELRRLRANVAFVHQHLALVPQLRVHQNVATARLGRAGLLSGLRAVLFPREAELVHMHALLERVGVAELLFRRTDTLSGGQQQRVALARALHQEPRLLLADEPVASVDPVRARAVLELLLAVCAERSIALLVSLHDLALAKEYFARLIGMRGGKVEFDAPREAISEAQWRALYRLEGHGIEVD